MHATNPVIRGFAPDPTIVWHDGSYYLATSSFEWFPTIPIYRSADLAHWEHVGAVDVAVPGGTLHGVPDSGGIWAPAMSWSDGVFWLVYSIVRSVGRRFYDLETYLTIAGDPSGPWAEPVRLPGHGFDPALFHHEGKHYLLNLQNDSRVGGRRFDGIVLTELNVPFVDGVPRLAQVRPVGRTHLLLQREELIEGPKITFREGWFYLLLAQGGTGVEHGVLVARSRSLTGPYEVDEQVLLTTRDDPGCALQKAGHGELVQTPTGEWFLSHLASRPVQTAEGPRNPLGRETAVQPISWSDGWPRLAHGGWHPATVVEVPDPLAGNAAAPEQGATGVESTSWPWSSLREPVGDWADTGARPGWLRLRGRMGPESLWGQSLLAQRLTEHQAQVSVLLEAEPLTFTQSAGLVLWYNTSSYYQLHVTWAEPVGEPQRGQQWWGSGRRVLVLVHGHPDGARRLAEVEVPVGPLRLCATINGPAVQLFWSPVRSASGESPLEPIGPVLDMTELSDDFGPTLRFTGAFVGLSAVDLVEGRWHADFTDFQLHSQPCQDSDFRAETKGTC